MLKNLWKKNQKIKKYFEVSALSGHNIDLSFDKIGKYLLINYGYEEINDCINLYKNLNSKNRKNSNDANKTKCCWY